SSALQNPSAPLISLENCNGDATAPGIQFCCQIGKEIVRRRFDEDVDLTGASETLPRVEAHHLRLAIFQHFERARRYFLFEATGAEQADRLPISANKHARAGTAITRALCVHERSESKFFATPLLNLVQNVVNILQTLISICLL